jgi:hypothetical protein
MSSRLSRLAVPLFLLAGGALAAGCGAEGSYQLSWRFKYGEDTYAPAATGCGLHGVDGIRITGGNNDGDSEGWWRHARMVRSSAGSRSGGGA